MQLKLKTATLQAMMARAMKGASCNKLIPITGMMCIQAEQGTLTLKTTDGTNYLYVRQDKLFVDNGGFEVTVWADTFAKLIARLTCDDVALELRGSCLHVTGNGSYSIELPFDDEGELVKFPDPVVKNNPWGNFDEVGTINLSTARLILATAKASLLVNANEPDSCYAGYYCGDRIITTNEERMCSIDITLWDKPALISSEMMGLLDVFKDEKIKVFRLDNKIMFESSDCTLYGTLMDSIDDYPIEVINALLDTKYDKCCCVPRSALLELLDRLVLFVVPYDLNVVNLTFTQAGLQVSSKASTGVEIIPYTASENFQPFTCSIDVEDLRAQVKASTADVLELYYGIDTAIKFVDGNVTQIVALTE